MEVLLVFNSTHQAIEVETVLKEEKRVRLIPTPEMIQSSCGLALKFNEADLSFVQEKLAQVKTQDLSFYRIVKDFNKKKTYLLIK